MVESAIAGRVSVAAQVFAPGHLGELTQVIDTALVDAVAVETGTVQRRVRLLPTRVVIYFVLALTLFDGCGYVLVWRKLTAGLGRWVTARPTASGLCRARRRVGAKPFQVLFEAIAGPLAWPGTPGAFWRGLRLVALDATCLRVPDDLAVTGVYRKRRGAKVTWGYPLLRLSVLAECGTRALLAAAFGPDTAGETVYAHRLLGCLKPGMLLLADAYYDRGRLLADISATGARWLIRSTATRRPLPSRRLPDGSYLSVLTTGGGLIEVRFIEAMVTIGYADGTVQTRQWRLITSLLDDRLYPATELLSLYHQRWEIETTYRSIKCTILDGRVLRSRRAADIDQEVWALLAVYQALTRLITDALTTQPGVDPDRASFTTALHTARDQVILAAGIHTPTHHHPIGHPAGHPAGYPVGVIGAAVLTHLLPPRRQRVKARTKKIASSQYKTASTTWPKTTLGYTIHTHITIFDKGLTPRSSP